MTSCVQAGHPSPADDWVERKIRLKDYLTDNPESTIFVRVAGDSMIGADINDGDLLVVDRSLEAQCGDIVVAKLEGELTVKRLRIKGKQTFLLPENQAYPPIAIHPETEASIWGVVTASIHLHRKRR